MIAAKSIRRRAPKKGGGPTPEAYGELQRAYDYFNRALFGGRLPPCLITLQRQRGAYGYFSGGRFHARGGKAASPRTADEIAMNPSHIGQREDRANLSTLAHEQCHLWQHHFGAPGRRGYHNREWAAKMLEIGLAPSTTGAPGGAETGEKMTHYIIEGGPFARAAKALLADGFRLTWHDPHQDEPAAKKKRNTRAKYTCPSCGLNAWAKPAAALVCGECEEPMDEDEAD